MPPPSPENEVPEPRKGLNVTTLPKIVLSLTSSAPKPNTPPPAPTLKSPPSMRLLLTCMFFRVSVPPRVFWKMPAPNPVLFPGTITVFDSTPPLLNVTLPALSINSPPPPMRPSLPPSVATPCAIQMF